MRLSRAYEQTKEFLSRQAGFDFAVVARAVLDIAVETRKKLQAFSRSFFKKVRAAVRKPHQLMLELDSLAQIPLFQICTN